MNYMQEHVKKLKLKSYSELTRLEAEFAEFLSDKKPEQFSQFRNYLEHIRCERAERIGK